MKRKSTAIIIFLITLMTNCLLIDAVGLTNTYSGDEAKKKIIAAAKVGDYQTAHAAFAAQGYTGSDLETMTLLDIVLASAIDNTVMKIDSSKYYKKLDIDTCAAWVATVGVHLDYDSFSTYAMSPMCHLHPDGEIIDENIGSNSNSAYRKKK
ncbi:TIGR04452 family lipoprotein [Leptospira semungkisensis]|uniref:TIGR04452 family lipoprotein n=1 Tax=Leptospira semungkisensis TaxID=2484985 RepID=A0A4R9G8Y0_9LEPT|nr:TIGR04452 family lipoprotein [Leptospira semungkisensis]TGK07510.1 TIGR04452 family lipoprotein [Leptospira semungkisensis]